MVRWRRVGVLLCLVSTSLGLSTSAQQSAPPRAAVPVDPVTAIIDAFGAHSVVALGEPHGNEQAHAFRVSLIRDRRFAERVNDIVVEVGNARYQDLIDRFVRGEDVPDLQLRQVWQSILGPSPVADLPIYEEFYRAVRGVNEALPRERQLRVLLGDPPVDWSTVATLQDAVKWAAVRDIHAADVIRREVLAKKRRALVIYGDMHLRRKHSGTDYMTEDPVTKIPVDGRTLVEQLESAGATRVFTIWTNTIADLTTVQADVASWPRPSMAAFRGTVLGAKDFTFYYPTSRDVARPMEDKFDALIYLGPPSTMTQVRLSPTLCADPAYMEMRLGRMALVGIPTEGLKKYCASVAPK